MSLRNTWPHGAPFSFRSYFCSCPFSASPAPIPIPINERPPSSQEFYYTVSVLVCKVGESNERANRSCIGDLPSHLGPGMCHYGGGWKCVCERIYTCFISKRTNGGGVEEDMDDGSVRGGRPFCMFMAQSSFAFSVSLDMKCRFMAQRVS